MTTVAADLVADPRGQLARAAADLEHAPGSHSATAANADVARIGAFGVRVERAPRLEVRLACVLARDGARGR